MGLVWRGVSQNWLLAEMAGLGPVPGQGWVQREATSSTE